MRQRMSDWILKSHLYAAYMTHILNIKRKIASKGWRNIYCISPTSPTPPKSWYIILILKQTLKKLNRSFANAKYSIYQEDKIILSMNMPSNMPKNVIKLSNNITSKYVKQKLLELKV